jgi:hypothetical protein
MIIIEIWFYILKFIDSLILIILFKYKINFTFFYIFTLNLKFNQKLYLTNTI